jgi:hypothetical protein
MGLPCAHILQVTDNLDIGMCDVRWWNNFCYHYGRRAEITKAFDTAIQNKLPGVPWKYIPKNDGVAFPIYSNGTTEEHYKEMKLLYDNFGRAFLKGSHMPLPKETNGDAYDDESIMGLQSSTGFSQAFEETVSIDDSMNDTSASQKPNQQLRDKLTSYQDLVRKFEAVFRIAEEDPNDLVRLESILDEFQTYLLGKHQKRNFRSANSEVVSLFPSLDKKRKSVNLCKY